MAETACQRQLSSSGRSTGNSGPSVPSSSASAPKPSFFSPRLTTPTRNPPSSSPNYFAFQSSDGGPLLSESSQLHTKKNWSPPSSTVRSTAAISPSIVPVDQNPDFDAFKRQSEEKTFNLGGLGANFRVNNAVTPRKKPVRSTSHTSTHEFKPVTPIDTTSAASRSRQTSLSHGVNGERSSPKRFLSPGADSSERRVAPASFSHDDVQSRCQDQPRFRLPLDNMTGSFGISPLHRAETLPSNGSNESSESQYMAVPQHVMTIIETNAEDMLLLDLRVSTQYSTAHVDGALNLCIPTTLLKRPSFNVQKLTEIFKDEEQKNKFEKWRNSKYIVVYDAASSQLKDAQTCLNTIKKFRSEGYQGTCYIIKGGFAAFSNRFPAQVSHGADASSDHSSMAVESEGPDVAPVVGGCPMPSTKNPANPFFGNIRQNMDLIGGVGQIALQHPKLASPSKERSYPEWLQAAADKEDRGKQVSQKFERIERREKKRMEDALAGNVTWMDPAKQQNGSELMGDKVQIAGIEKGNKNRYNNIWPFEHSRVKLQGVPRHECDYFNANFIQAGWSHKRYISTQAPIPATFADFWNVVWQQDVRVIVMLTAEKEGAQVKAHNYWSDKNYGPLRLDFLSEKRASLELSRIHKHQKTRPGTHTRTSTLAFDEGAPLAVFSSQANKQASATDHGGVNAASGGDQPYVIVRRFTLTNEKKPFEPMREITQLQYSSWPDFGAPAHPAHLLGLVEQTDAVARAVNNGISAPSIHEAGPRRQRSTDPEPAGTRPIMVHCSAGCGRTGTFCTVDSVIDMLKRQHISRSSGYDSRMDIDQKQPSARTSAQSRGTLGMSQDEMTDSHNSSSAHEQPLAASGPEGAWVDRDDLDLVEQTVEDFRHQRLSMVQSLRQYVLCYESVMEWLIEEQRKRSDDETA